TFFTSNITTFRDSGDIRGGNALLRWTRQLDGNDNFNLQLYYDRFDREDSVAAHTTDTWDIDFQHQKKLTSKLNMLWGLGYRHIRYDFDNSLSILQLNPSGGKLNTYSAFIQGDYDI